MVTARHARVHKYVEYGQRQKAALWFRASALALLLTATAAMTGCGGSVSTETLPVAPANATGSATLSWSAPTTNADGTPLTSLGGYKVYYGTTPGVYASIIVGNATSYSFHDLLRGKTYYFTVTAYDASGNESDYSAVVSKSIS
jgi:ABC-type oligopeptide transport system substrate-binding subunit